MNSDCRWWLRVEPRGEAYMALLKLLSGDASMCGLIIRNHKYIDAVGRYVLDRLAADLVSTTLVSEWPGTSTRGPKSERLLYRISDRFIDVLGRVVPGLYSWIDNLPEDLHLLASDGRIVLETSASEREGIVSLTMKRRRGLAVEAPLVSDCLSSDPAK